MTENARHSMPPACSACFVPIEAFGKDHWSTFAYIETVVVDHRGYPDRRRMRCDATLHPGLAHLSGACPPTRIKDGQISSHDDWSCADDLEAAGLVKHGGTGMHPRFALTPYGKTVAAMLRVHKASGGRYADFTPAGP